MTPPRHRRVRRHRQRLAAAVLVLALVAGACSDPARSSDEFCDKLAEVTGPLGVEVALDPNDPSRLDGVVSELRALHDHAPDDISTTTLTLVNFFTTYQRSPRNERRGLLATNEETLLAASAELDRYALDECGLFLQRAVPTPVPDSDPGVEVAPE